jgi:hypothetical protein
MKNESRSKHFPVEEAIKAQKALRAAAGLGPEMFPVEAFVGMVRDEIEALRKSGSNDEEVATLVRQHSSIDITARDIFGAFCFCRGSSSRRKLVSTRSFKSQSMRC